MKTSRDFFRKYKTRLAVVTGIAAGVLAFAAIAAASAPQYVPLHVHVGEKAPDFSLPSAEGGSVSLSQFAGHNVLLDFYEGYW